MKYLLIVESSVDLTVPDAALRDSGAEIVAAAPIGTDICNEIVSQLCTRFHEDDMEKSNYLWT